MSGRQPPDPQREQREQREQEERRLLLAMILGDPGLLPLGHGFGFRVLAAGGGGGLLSDDQDEDDQDDYFEYEEPEAAARRPAAQVGGDQGQDEDDDSEDEEQREEEEEEEEDDDGDDVELSSDSDLSMDGADRAEAVSADQVEHLWAGFEQQLPGWFKRRGPRRPRHSSEDVVMLLGSSSDEDPADEGDQEDVAVEQGSAATDLRSRALGRHPPRTPTSSDDKRPDQPQPSLKLPPTGLDARVAPVNIRIHPSRRMAAYVGRAQHLQDFGGIRADRPVPAALGGVFYFETKLLAVGPAGSTVTVGLAGDDFVLTHALGFTSTSFGYRSDHGRRYSGAGGSAYGPSFGKGDVIGCGVNFFNNSVFFTKNGQHLGTAFSLVVDVNELELERGPEGGAAYSSLVLGGADFPLYPVVSLHGPGQLVAVNFRGGPLQQPSPLPLPSRCKDTTEPRNRMRGLGHLRDESSATEDEPSEQKQEQEQKASPDPEDAEAVRCSSSQDKDEDEGDSSSASCSSSQELPRPAGLGARRRPRADSHNSSTSRKRGRRIGSLKPSRRVQRRLARAGSGTLSAGPRTDVAATASPWNWIFDLVGYRKQQQRATLRAVEAEPLDHAQLLRLVQSYFVQAGYLGSFRALLRDVPLDHLPAASFEELQQAQSQQRQQQQQQERPDSPLSPQVASTAASDEPHEDDQLAAELRDFPLVLPPTVLSRSLVQAACEAASQQEQQPCSAACSAPGTGTGSSSSSGRGRSGSISRDSDSRPCPVHGIYHWVPPSALPAQPHARRPSGSREGPWRPRFAEPSGPGLAPVRHGSSWTIRAGALRGRSAADVGRHGSSDEENGVSGGDDNHSNNGVAGDRAVLSHLQQRLMSVLARSVLGEDSADTVAAATTGDTEDDDFAQDGSPARERQQQLRRRALQQQQRRNSFLHLEPELDSDADIAVLDEAVSSLLRVAAAGSTGARNPAFEASGGGMQAEEENGATMRDDPAGQPPREETARPRRAGPERPQMLAGFRELHPARLRALQRAASHPGGPQPQSESSGDEDLDIELQGPEQQQPQPESVGGSPPAGSPGALERARRADQRTFRLQRADMLSSLPARKAIRDAVVAGDPERARELLRAGYPGLLEQFPELDFRLDSLRFLAMVRAAKRAPVAGLLSAVQFAQQRFAGAAAQATLAPAVQQAMSLLAFGAQLDQHPLAQPSYPQSVAALANACVLAHLRLPVPPEASALGLCLRQLGAVVDALGPQGLSFLDCPELGHAVVDI